MPVSGVERRLASTGKEMGWERWRNSVRRYLASGYGKKKRKGGATELGTLMRSFDAIFSFSSWMEVAEVLVEGAVDGVGVLAVVVVVDEEVEEEEGEEEVPSSSRENGKAV